MNAHNKTQFTYTRINCVLKDSSCDTPLPKILMLAILATCVSSSSTKNQESDATLTLKKRNTIHVFTYRLPLFFNRSSVRLTQDQKGPSKACNGDECQGMNQFNKWLITTRCKEFTYCLCNFIWSRRSHAFMFVRLIALFKSSVLIGTNN
ncbi:hypothetical protein H5410_057030 [Solanum commersonii]|uniref:Uncharacterized protein n=1 Tax=Solanum commersonii TaxID=4109 RepID=A0A9J5WPF4_SOLCO|nr:hypothetical protein H5410_057030 [Solanum commersonii]